MNKSKLIKGAIGIGLIAGAGAAIYKAYKTYKKEQKEQEEFLKERIKEKEREANQKIEDINDDIGVDKKAEEEQAFMDYINDEPDRPHPNEIKKKPTLVIDDRPYNITRSREKMNYDPNSDRAWTQYKMMMVSDYDECPDMHDTLLALFEFDIYVLNSRDITIRDKILEDRIRFFGKDSKYTDSVSTAELLIFYASQINDDFGMEITDAMDMIMCNLDLLRDDIGQEDYSELTSDLCGHSFWNDDGQFGMFGLGTKDYDSLYDFPEVIVNEDKDISYEMEYNVFVKVYGDEI